MILEQIKAETTYFPNNLIQIPFHNFFFYMPGLRNMYRTEPDKSGNNWSSHTLWPFLCVESIVDSAKRDMLYSSYMSLVDKWYCPDNCMEIV